MYQSDYKTSLLFSIKYVGNHYYVCLFHANKMELINHRGHDHIVHMQSMFIAARDRRGCDRMVVGFTTTYAIRAYHY
jgi:hypothetical protein